MEYLKSSRFLALLFFIFTLFICCIAMISISGMTSQWKAFREETLPALSIENGSRINTAANQNHEQWIVRAHDERIGVFNINGELEYIVDVYLITLPLADQQLLEEGIYVSDADQLTALMEDYTG